MVALGKRKTVHLARSLDHYCHQRVSREELQKRVEDQVLTRFMERHGSISRKTPLTTEKPDHPKMFLSMCSKVVEKLRPSNLRPHVSARPEAAMEEGQGEGTSTKKAVRDAEMLEDGAPKFHRTQPPQILVVPQLWLWKFDSEYDALGYFRSVCDRSVMTFTHSRLPADLVITSYPERWDCTYQRDSLLGAIRKRVEYLNIDHELDSDKLVSEILNVCAEFQPTLAIGDQIFTWTDAFDDEILSVVSQISSFEFQN